MEKQKIVDTLNKMTSTHNGHPLDHTALLKPNAMVAKVLVARYLDMTPQQQKALQGINTPDTAAALKIFLPELAKIIERKVENNGGQ